MCYPSLSLRQSCHGNPVMDSLNPSTQKNLTIKFEMVYNTKYTTSNICRVVVNHNNKAVWKL